MRRIQTLAMASTVPRRQPRRQLARSRLALPAWLVLMLCLAPACSTRYDHSIAVVRCKGTTLEVIERYRRQGFSGWTGNSRIVLRVEKEGFWRRTREIDVTPIDTVDLSVLERLQPAGLRWRALAPQDKVSRRVFVSPKEFSVEEY